MAGKGNTGTLRRGKCSMRFFTSGCVGRQEKLEAVE